MPMMPCETKYFQVECHIDDIADTLNNMKYKHDIIAIENFRVLETSNSKFVILIMECAVFREE